MTLSGIVFDFDGTLVESVDVKTQAFRTLFAGEADVDRIVALHLEQGGRSRYEKFAMIYRDVLRRDPKPGEFEELGVRFERLVYDAVTACPYVPGAESFLREYSRRLPMIVVSGTPHDELLRLLDDRAMSTFFLEAHGSPPEKAEILSGVLSRHRWRSNDVALVGDAMSDYAAARACRIGFIGRVPAGCASPFPKPVRTIADLSELGPLIGVTRHESPPPNRRDG
jgi:phosphoglycolate phosphatase-like HAD superfamily hydrolase